MKKIISLYTLFLLLAFAVCAHAGSIAYTYDWAGRLTKADYGNGKSITYTYDNAGNLLNETASSSTVTPCEGKAELIAVNPVSLELKRKAIGNVTVTVTGNGGCPVEGQKVKAIIRGTIKISPKNANTDKNGEATFTITARGKTGKAMVTFKAGRLKAKVPVKVTK